jgi:hypothetical protein
MTIPPEISISTKNIQMAYTERINKLENELIRALSKIQALQEYISNQEKKERGEDGINLHK